MLVRNARPGSWVTRSCRPRHGRCLTRLLNQVKAKLSQFENREGEKVCQAKQQLTDAFERMGRTDVQLRVVLLIITCLRMAVVAERRLRVIESSSGNMVRLKAAPIGLATNRTFWVVRSET